MRIERKGLEQRRGGMRVPNERFPCETMATTLRIRSQFVNASAHVTMLCLGGGSRWSTSYTIATAPNRLYYCSVSHGTMFDS
jgi:hypothetical protein